MTVNVGMLLDIPSSIVPDDVALIDASGALTYETLRRRASLAAGLLGVSPGERVGILATNRAELVELFFAASLLGAAVVPMNFRAGRDEIAHLLADSGVRVLLTEQRYLEVVDAVRPATLESVIRVDEPAYAERRDAAEPYEDIADVDDSELAALLYTSGTTALPKGVMLSYGALSGYVLQSAECADGTEQGRTLLAAPLFHIAGITSLLTSVYSGRATVLLPQFEAGAWLEAVEKHRATHAFVVPTMLSRVIEHPDATTRDLSSLELVTYGAAPMPPAVIRRALDIFPSSVSFSGAYGQTETTSTVTVLLPEDHRLNEGDVEAKLRRLSSVGRAVDDVEIRIVGEDDGALPTGQTGEVQLRTARSMDGYWGKAERTRVTIDDEGWVHTGDLGHLDDEGYLFLSGRSGGLIIRGGENIAPEEVEAVLFEFPGVADVAAVGVPDETWGERVVVAVVLQSDTEPDEAAIIAHCASRLASFKRPERVLFVSELPRTSTGKLVRRDVLPIIEELLAT